MNGIGSPIVVGDVVVFSVGSIGTGVDKFTGKIRWGWTGGGSDFTSPIHIQMDGKDYVTGVFGDPGGHALSIVDAENGKLFQKMSYPGARFAQDPICIDGNMLLNNELFSIKSNKRIWISKESPNYVPSIINNGFLYMNTQRKLCCIDLTDGSLKSSGTIPEAAGFIMAQDKLLVVDGGNLNLVQVSPEEIKPIYKLKLPGNMGKDI